MLRTFVLGSRKLLKYVNEKGARHGGGVLRLACARTPLPPPPPRHLLCITRRMVHSTGSAARKEDNEKPKTFPPLIDVEMTPVKEKQLWQAGSISPILFAKGIKAEQKVKKRKKRKLRKEKKPVDPAVPCPPTPDPPYLAYLIAAAAALLGLLLLRYLFGGKKSKTDYGANYPGLGKPRRRKARYQHPKSTEDFPHTVKYLVIGGGTAGLSAVKGITSIDPDAQVLMISSENSPPYRRNPLTRDLAPQRSDIFYEKDDFFLDTKTLREKEKGVGLARGWTVEKLDLQNKQVILPGGRAVGYDRCLLATGSVPFNMKIFEKVKPEIGSKVIVLHDLCDYEQLRAAVRDGAQDIIVLGSNARACEVSWMLASHARQFGLPRVHLVYPQDALIPDLLPKYLGKWLASRVEETGVCLWPQSRVRKVTMTPENHMVVRLNSGQRLKACRVVVSVHSAPETSIAKESKLHVDKERGGFLANNELRTEPEVWAAGDCVSYCLATAGRVHSHGSEHASASGTVAGRNMARSTDPLKESEMKCYDHFPVRTSSPCPGITMEALGDPDPLLPTVGVFASARATGSESLFHHPSCQQTGVSKHTTQADYSRGVIFYLRKDEVVGLLLWNMPNRLSAARDIVEGGYFYKDLDVAVQQLCLHK